MPANRTRVYVAGACCCCLWLLSVTKQKTLSFADGVVEVADAVDADVVVESFCYCCWWS